MRFVDVNKGVLELNYMWLPTWLGLNQRFKEKLEKDLTEKFKGRLSSELDDIHEEVIDYIVEAFPLPGLRDYLDGVKFVEG